MSTALKRTARPSPAEGANPPFIGALLRLCWQRARRRIVEAIRAEGFTDLQDAHLVVLRYPPPDCVRPSVLARQLQEEWAAKVGQKRFDVLMAVLRELAVEEEGPATAE